MCCLVLVLSGSCVVWFTTTSTSAIWLYNRSAYHCTITSICCTFTKTSIVPLRPTVHYNDPPSQSTCDCTIDGVTCTSEQYLEPNSSLNSVSFEFFFAVFKLSVTCSSGPVRHNSAGKFYTISYTTLNPFNISHSLRIFQAVRQFTNFYLEQSEGYLYYLGSVYTPLPHSL
jgi:site-specific DNA-adenine methylase